MSTGKSFLRSMAWSAVVVLSMYAAPASAQALGDADCPGGYYFSPAYSICVPYGYTYAPDNYGYAPPVYAPYIYGPPYVVVTPPRDHGRDRRDGRGFLRDDDRSWR